MLFLIFFFWKHFKQNPWQNGFVITNDRSLITNLSARPRHHRPRPGRESNAEQIKVFKSTVSMHIEVKETAETSPGRGDVFSYRTLLTSQALVTSSQVVVVV